MIKVALISLGIVITGLTGGISLANMVGNRLADPCRYSQIDCQRPVDSSTVRIPRSSTVRLPR